MRSLIVSILVCLTTVAASANAQSSSSKGCVTVERVGRFKLQSNAWVNLHQWLMYEASFKDGHPPAGLDANQLKKWNELVTAYKTFIARHDPISGDELIRTNETLSATRDFTLPATVPKAAADVLREAMPIYHVTQWPEDDRVNRFWISLAVPLLRAASDDLAAANSKAYGVAFPTHILVDVSSFGWQFGSYTVGEGDHAHAVMSSLDPANQGEWMLESLFHEPSHAIVDANSGAIGNEIAKLSKELGIKPRYNLWHAILFYTAGELTRREWLKLGVSDYQPIITRMYSIQFQGFEQPLRTHWQAYLDGKRTREEAIRQILIDTAGQRK
jgi:hypothetical protein